MSHPASSKCVAKQMAKGVAARRLSEPRLTYGDLHGALHGAFMPTVADRLAGVWVLAERIRRKHVLPTPLRGVTRVLACEGRGQGNSRLALLSLPLEVNA
jgi:hypothetical protein